MPMVAGRNGGKLLPGGKPGNRGGLGRPPKTYQLWLKSLLDSEKHREAYTRLMETPGQHLVAATKHASDTVYGKPEAKVKMGGGIVLTLRKARE